MAQVSSLVVSAANADGAAAAAAMPSPASARKSRRLTPPDTRGQPRLLDALIDLSLFGTRFFGEALCCGGG